MCDLPSVDELARQCRIAVTRIAMPHSRTRSLCLNARRFAQVTAGYVFTGIADLKAAQIQRVAYVISRAAVGMGDAVQGKSAASMGAVRRIAEMSRNVLRTLTLIASPLSQRAVAVVLVAMLAIFAGLPGAMANRFVTPERAYEAGLDAYRNGAFDDALPALEEAAKSGIVEARFFLARIRGDASLPYHDRAKAYRLYLAIVDEYANIDRADAGAPFVSKSLIALAHYLRQGVASAGVAANVPRALQYLDHAAKYFGDPDAQFEIARLYLSGEDLPKDT
jgi:hypothetical protein